MMKKLLTCILLIFAMLTPALSYVPATTAFAAETVATPTKPTVTNVVKGIRVKWTAIDGVEKYGVWRSETGKNGTYKWMGNPTQNSYLDEKVQSGKTYFYKVTCMIPGTNNHGEKSEPSGIIFVSTPDFTGRYNKAAGVTLEWEKITGATGYAIYRKSFAGTDAWVRIGEVTSGSTLKWTDTSVKNNNGKIYRYAVRALAGTNRKTLSGCRPSGRTMVRLTSRVLNSATAASDTSVKCSWTTTKEATGYEIRFMVGTTVYKTFVVGNYKTGVKTFTGLEPETTYKIQVRSYKKVDGVGGFYSAWSEAKYATTKAETGITGTVKVSAPNKGYAKITFDKNGNMTEQAVYSSKDVLLYKNTVNYDEDGVLDYISCKDASGKQMGNVYFYWDGKYLERTHASAYNGKIIVATNVSKKAGAYQATYAELEKGYTKQTGYKPSGTIEYTYLNQLNEDNKVVKSWDTYYGVKDGYQEYTYGQNGKVSRIDNYNRENGIFNGYQKYDYYADGTQKQYTYYDETGVVTNYTKYNEEGKYIESASSYWYNSDVAGYTITKYEYVNNKRNEVSCIRYDLTENIIWETEYKKDTNGNLVGEYLVKPDGTKESYEEFSYYTSGQRKQSASYRGDGNLKSLYQYNEDGTTKYAEGYSYHYETGEATSYWLSVYDENDRLERRTYYNPADKSTVKYYYTYEYDKYGDISKETQYSPDDLVEGKIIYQDGERVEEYYYEYDGNTVTDSCSYTYNLYGNQLSYTTYDEAGKVVYSTEFEYDEYGDEISETEYDANGNQTSREEYERDEAGNAIVVIYYDGEEESYRYEYEYDENGKRILRKYIQDGVVYSITGYEYNEQGKVSKEIEYNDDGDVTEYTTYEYYTNGRNKSQASYGEYSSGYEVEYLYEYYETGYQKSYYYYNRNWDGTINYYTVRRYEDGTGSTLEEAKYDAEDNLISYTEYEYYAKNKYSRKTEYDAERNILSEEVVEYYESGKQKSRTYYKEGGEAGGKINYAYTYYESGNTKEYTYYRYDYSTGELQYYSVRKYDENYNITDEIKYDAEGNLLSYFEYEYYSEDKYSRKAEYDADNNILSEELWDYYEDDTEKSHEKYLEGGKEGGKLDYAYEYYENGKNKKYSDCYYDSSTGELRGYSIAIYNEDGKTLESTNYDSEGNISYQQVYDYYANGECKSNIYYANGGKENGRISYLYEYYENGVEKKYVSYYYNYSTGELSSYNETLYDEDGNSIEYTRYDAEGNVTSQELSEYYSNGERKSCVSYTNGGKDNGGRISSINEYYESGYNKKNTYYYYNSSTGEFTSAYAYVYADYVSYTTIREISYDADMNINYESVYEYYDDGERKSCAQYGKGGEEAGHIEYKYEYYEDGYTTKESTNYYYDDITGELSYYIVTRYDEDGYYESSTSYNPDGTVRN